MSRETIVAQARANADEVIAQADTHRDEVLGNLEGTRAELEREIGELCSFEQSYRSRLRAYIEDALAQFDGSVSVADATDPTSLVQASIE